MTNISDLRFDDKNFNAHTEYGMSLLEKSLRENGAGRSILIDKDNRIIAGNGIIEAAGNIGLEDLQIVETDGTKIVAVKRTDVALDSEKGRTMALADNATAAADLSWDKGNIEEVSEKFDIDPGDWISDWNKDEDTEVEEDDAPEVNESEPAKKGERVIKKLTKHEISILAFELRNAKLLPLKGLRVYFDERDGLNKIDFVSANKQLTVDLISGFGQNEYDDKAIEKQLKEYFLEGEK